LLIFKTHEEILLDRKILVNETNFYALRALKLFHPIKSTYQLDIYKIFYKLTHKSGIIV